MLLIILGVVCYLSISGKSLLIPKASNDATVLAIATTLLPIITCSLAAIFGILIAVYLLSSQIAGRRPYSRLVRTFYGSNDFPYFTVFFISLLYPVYIHASWAYIAASKRYHFIDVSVALYTACILCLASLMLKHLSIFNPKQVAERALQAFTVASVIRYGLVLVEVNTHNEQVKYHLKTWGHRHNLSDPLGAFHDILMEAIETKERTTLHLYLSVLIEKVAYLNNARFRRRFGLATGPVPFQFVSEYLDKLPVIGGSRKVEIKIQVVVHALHYVVRRAQKMIAEWQFDNHRQIFVINIADLILAFARNIKNAVVIDICLYAILKICYDYRNVPIHGSYEPLKDMFQLVPLLQKAELNREANLALKILAYLDLNTPYLSKNTSVNYEEIIGSLSTENIEYFNNQKSALMNMKYEDIFSESIWKPA